MLIPGERSAQDGRDAKDARHVVRDHLTVDARRGRAVRDVHGAPIPYRHTLEHAAVPLPLVEVVVRDPDELEVPLGRLLVQVDQP